MTQPIEYDTTTFSLELFLKGATDQFDLLVIIPLKLFCIDFSITNYFVMSLLSLLCLFSITFLPLKKSGNEKEKFIYPQEWSKLVEILIETTSSLTVETIKTNNKKFYLPVILVVFIFIVFNNILGLIPYSFTGTSHMFVTLYLSLSIFLGINIILAHKHKEKSFSLFIPANSDTLLALLLVPIELVSYVVRPISLGVRLFVNIMSGHTLIKVIIGFSWTILLVKGFTSIFLLIPMIVLTILFFLEFSVALIQAYVFTILSCIYIQDIN